MIAVAVVVMVVMVVMMAMLLFAGRNRLDCALDVVLYRLQRIRLATHHDLDTTLSQTRDKALTRAAGHQCVNTVDRMVIAVKLVE